MKNEGVKVSVIVPVYNTVDYLGECLDSLSSQTLQKIEFICVNDGSTDGSLELMLEYAKRDSRIKVIDKQNSGYGNSVNRGLSEAVGEYVGIVEPDDFISPFMFQNLYEAASLSDGKMADIVKSSYWEYFDFEKEGSLIKEPNLMKCMPKKDMVFNVFENVEIGKHHPSIWSAIYKREFLESNHIRMIEPKGAGWADNPWFYETILCAEQIKWVPEAYYYYRQTNPNSSSNKLDYHLPFDRLRDIREILIRLKVSDKAFLETFYSRTFSYIFYTVFEKFGYTDSDSELMSLIKEALCFMDVEILKNSKSRLLIWGYKYYLDIFGEKIRMLPAVEEAEKPVLSFIVPFGNDEMQIWNTFDSVLGQSFRDIEVICVNCGCSDRTVDIVKEASLIDKRIKLIELGDAVQMKKACIEGLSAAKGSYCFWITPGSRIGKNFLNELDKLLLNANYPDCVCIMEKSKENKGLLTSEIKKDRLFHAFFEEGIGLFEFLVEKEHVCGLVEKNPEIDLLGKEAKIIFLNLSKELVLFVQPFYIKRRDCSKVSEINDFYFGWIEKVKRLFPDNISLINSCYVHSFYEAYKRFILADSGREVWNVLRDKWWKLGLSEISPREMINSTQYMDLNKAFYCEEYEYCVRDEFRKCRTQLNILEKKNKKLNNRVVKFESFGPIRGALYIKRKLRH